MNFDQLKNQWQVEDAELDTRVQLNKAALRQQLLQQSQKAVRRLRWLKGVELLSNAVMIVLLSLFCWRYRHEAHLLWSGVTVLFVQSWYAVIAWTQHRDLQALDYSQAVIVVQQQLERLRERRLQSIKQLVVLGFAAWPAFSIVLVKGLLGIDLFRLLGEVATHYYIGAGLLLALMLWLTWTAIAAITPHISWLQAMRHDAAGATVNAALNHLKAVRELEQNAAPTPTAKMLQWLAQLRRAPLLAVYFKALIMIVLGVGNAMHGGQAAWLIPGIVLTVFTGTQIAFSAMQLTLLRRGQQTINQSLLSSTINAYHSAVTSNARWLTYSMPITTSALLLLLVKLVGIELSVMTLLSVMAVALVGSLLMTRSGLHSVLIEHSENWINFVSGDALTKLKQALQTKKDSSQ